LDASPTASPRRRASRLALLALALAVAACGAQAVRSARRAIASCHPAHKPIDPAARAAVRAAIPALEEVSFRTGDGLTLRGWYAPGTHRAAVILVHGGYDNRAHWVPELRTLAARGYGVLAYDSRASGESDGDLLSAGDRERGDVAAALDFVTARADVDPRRVGVVGFSYGSSAVLLTAAKDARARAVVLEATWTSLEDEIMTGSGRFPLLTGGAALWAMRHEGVDVDAVRPIDHVAELAPRPLLVITGSADTDTPVAVMQRVFRAAAAPKELWIVDGADHGEYAAVAPDEYARRLVAFFDAALLR
jgi:uncharacterized protein